MNNDRVNNRKAAKALAYKQALAGDPVCRDYFIFKSTLTKGGEPFIETVLDYADDDEDDFRPY
jgi:hypothetical protein